MSEGSKQRRSLLRELSLLLLGLVTLLLGFHGFRDYQQEQQILTDALRLEAGQSLSRLAVTVAPSMAACAQNEYDKLIEHEIRLTGHQAIVVYDYRMGEVTGGDPYVSGRLRDASGAVRLFDPSDAGHLQLLQDAFIDEYSPVLDPEGVEIGSVRIVVDRGRLERNQQETLLHSVIEVMLTAAVLSLLLMLAVYRHLLTPLRELAQALHDRDEDGIPKQGIPDFAYRELNVLTDTMDDMVSGIRRSRAALRAEQGRLQAVIEGSETGVWEWNLETQELHCNEYWANFVGYTLEELRPVSIETWIDRLHPEDAADFWGLLRQHFSGASPKLECEYRMRHKQGHWVWIRAHGQVSKRGDDGQPLLMLGTHQEISEQKHQALQLAESEARFRGFFEQNLSVMLLIDPVNGKIRGANASADSYYGYGPGALVGQGISQINVLAPDRIATARRRTLEAGRAQFHFRHRLANGEVRDVEINSTPIQVDNKTLLFSIIHDITERIRGEQRLRLSGNVFTHAREGILITDNQTRIVEVNEAFTRITGYEREDVLGRDPKFLSSGRQDAAFYKQMWDQLEKKDHWHGEVWNRRKDGEPYAELLTISAVRDDADEVQNYVALFSDITALKKNEQQLERIAHFDALTGLPNRLLFGDRLRQAIRTQARRGGCIGVLFLDLDGFKAVNDEFGHETGDELLVMLAVRMQESIRAGDTLARIGGDEFVAILEDLPDRDQCRPVIRRLLDNVASAAMITGKPIQVSASIGLTFFPQGQEVSADQLLRQADQAMYQAKLAGKNRYQIFDTAYDEQLRGRHQQLERIQSALDNNEFVLLYQPKVNMHTGELVGAEALIRWQHPRQGLLAPMEFLPKIEGEPLMVDIGEWTLNQAMGQIEDWHTQGIDTRVSVNIAAVHLQKEDFVPRLKAALAAHPSVRPGQLELEILETSAVENINHVLEVIKGCQDLGVTLALDDFGTGYSSLTYLRRLPAEVLKIDRSFVRDMQDDPEDLTILEGVISLARAFDRHVLAEGVETEAHGQMLIWLGCQLGQGYGIARPMPAAELAGWLANWRAPASWREAVPISRDKVPAIFAMVQHRSWIAALERYLDGQEASAPELDPQECQFGRWLKTCEGLTRPALDMISTLHDAVHDVGQTLTSARGRLNDIDLDALRTELYRRRDALVTALLAVAHDRPEQSGQQSGPEDAPLMDSDCFGGSA